jgi:hypothetical protein
MQIKKYKYKYSQICPKNHFRITATCQQRPVWSHSDQPEAYLKKKYFSVNTLHNDHIFQVPRVLVIHRLFGTKFHVGFFIEFLSYVIQPLCLPNLIDFPKIWCCPSFWIKLQGKGSLVSFFNIFLISRGWALFHAPVNTHTPPCANRLVNRHNAENSISTKRRKCFYFILPNFFFL